mmetsp:Transcript_1490/g.4411  ORF Transcript_1490/g.4411 Transcript_1490/m.4411 type:complete len:453 (-) Transcript_1490:408-1766(-)
MLTDRYVLGSLIVAFGTMGCYISKWRWCLMGGAPAEKPTRGEKSPRHSGQESESEGRPHRQQRSSSGKKSNDDDVRERAPPPERQRDDDDETHRTCFGSASKASPFVSRKRSVQQQQGRRLRVIFSSPVVRKEHLVPALCDLPKWVRDEMYWGVEDYAAIRDNQRRLIELVLRQVREYPEGVLPPPIPGESRRGLGIICEPGTNSGRAARVRSARRAVVEAYRDGYSAEMISKLAQELSLWATKNAYDVGLKDHQVVGPNDHQVVGVGNFDINSFRKESMSVEVSPMDTTDDHDDDDDDDAAGDDFFEPEDDDDDDDQPEPEEHHPQSQNKGVAHAQRRDDLGLPKKPSFSSDNSSERSSSGDRQANDVGDGFGLASMIRSDSYNNLLQRNNSSDRTEPSVALAPSSPAAAEATTTRDGLGLASMIRNDSLGNLAALDTPDEDTPMRPLEAY